MVIDFGPKIVIDLGLANCLNLLSSIYYCKRLVSRFGVMGNDGCGSVVFYLNKNCSCILIYGYNFATLK